MSSTPQLPGYELIALLGTGSFASVWSAYDLRLDREVAVKVLSEDWCRHAEVRRSFMNEARVLVTSESHRLARGFIVDETTDGRPYLVMALADRGTLGERMAQRRAADRHFSPSETFSIIGELASAVRDVHALGHVHRDIKPNNVLIMERPKGSDGPSLPGLAFDERIVLSDFGLVSRLDTDGSASLGGSPAYVAPEQARGDADSDERVDLFPLGVIALEMMTGRAADRPTSLEQAATVRHDPRRRVNDAGVAMPDAAVDLLDRLLRPNPAERPQSAAAIAAMCRDIVRDLDHADASAAQTSDLEGNPDARRGVWGQALDLDVPPSASPAAVPAETTVVRPRDVRGPESASPRSEPDMEPRPRRTTVALDVGIGITAVALVVVAVLLWLT